MKGKSPCLTRSRAKNSGHWLLKFNRYMTHDEILNLMGVSSRDFASQAVSPANLRAMAGNAVPIPLVMRVLETLLDAAAL